MTEVVAGTPTPGVAPRAVLGGQPDDEPADRVHDPWRVLLQKCTPWLKERLYRVNGREYSLMTTLKFVSNKEGAHVDIEKDTEVKDMERSTLGMSRTPIWSRCSSPLRTAEQK